MSKNEIRIALAGNPNAGKTTLFNALTGSNQFVGNWPGVTVEKKEGKLKGHKNVIVMDLPGIYSLSPYTLEEVVARNYLIGERPDAILNIIDGTNLERNLYLTTQLVELGIPFSDPTAEGPVIQEANLRALTAGTTTDKVFDLVRDLRRDVTIPFVFMTYANVVFSYGAERFFSTCAEIGVDGLILPDLPFEEKEEFLPLCRQCGVNLISMIAPTSENRIAMIAKEAEGFLYVVSSLGVTGTRSEIKTDLASIVDVVRRNTAIPCAIGFGISTPEQAHRMASIADGAIVGSAIVKQMAQYGKEAPAHVGEFVRRMKQAL